MLTSLAHWIQDQIAANGLWAVFGLMVLESACIPMPSEVTMIYAGYLVSQGDMVFWQAVLVGAFANLVGSWIAWAAGAYGVDVIWLRSGHTRARIDQAHRWFERYGSRVVFFSRMLPIIRTFISLPAGIARMPLGRFTVLTFLGCLPWCRCWSTSATRRAPTGTPGTIVWATWTTWWWRPCWWSAGWWLLRRRRAASV